MPRKTTLRDYLTKKEYIDEKGRIVIEDSQSYKAKFEVPDLTLEQLEALEKTDFREGPVEFSVTIMEGELRDTLFENNPIRTILAKAVADREKVTCEYEVNRNYFEIIYTTVAATKDQADKMVTAVRTYDLVTNNENLDELAKKLKTKAKADITKLLK